MNIKKIIKPIKIAKDPKGPKEGSFRVVRGGSWYYSARNLRSACRYSFSPGFRYSFVGFRLVRTPRIPRPSYLFTIYHAELRKAISDAKMALEKIEDLVR